MSQATRTCLKCGRPFDSTGPGNRICRKCHAINAKLPPMTEAQLQKQRGEKRRNGEPMDLPADS